MKIDPKKLYVSTGSDTYKWAHYDLDNLSGQGPERRIFIVHLRKKRSIPGWHCYINDRIYLEGNTYLKRTGADFILPGWSFKKFVEGLEKALTSPLVQQSVMVGIFS